MTAFAVIVVGGVVASLLNVVPLIGFIASAFVGFYVAVTAYYIIGHTWSDIRHVPVQERPEAAVKTQI